MYLTLSFFSTSVRLSYWNSVLDSVGEGEGGMIWENGIEICIISYMKRVASPGSMRETGRSGLVHWDDPEGWDRVGEGLRMEKKKKKKSGCSDE